MNPFTLTKSIAWALWNPNYCKVFKKAIKDGIELDRLAVDCAIIADRDHGYGVWLRDVAKKQNDPLEWLRNGHGVLCRHGPDIHWRSYLASHGIIDCP